VRLLSATVRQSNPATTARVRHVADYDLGQDADADSGDDHIADWIGKPYRLGEDAARPGVVNGAEGGAPAHDEQRSSHDGAVEQHTCERDRSRGEQQ